MRIDELKSAIFNSIRAKDFVGEFAPANIELHKQRLGTFEAVLTGNGNEKCLIPEIGTVHYLYRGQNSEFVPCLPTIYRGNKGDVDVFINRMRLVAFKRLLDSHPVVERFFKKHNFLVSVEGLAQHYGIETEILDLTSSLDVALFFAVCIYNADSDSYDYYREGEHSGILYVFDPFYDNEPAPPLFLDRYMNGLIKPIGFQVFQRPSAQYGYGLHLQKGKSVKCWMYEIEFSAEESRFYYNLFNGGKDLWIKDRFVPKVNMIKSMTGFSYSLFNETFNFYRPKGWSASKMKRALKDRGVVLNNCFEDILFNAGECQEIVGEWNDCLGREFASKIVRKGWYKFNDSCGKYGQMDFMTMEHLAEYFTLLSVVDVDGPEGAIWKNYTGMPCERNKGLRNAGYVHKVDACMNSVFGVPYLLEEDWVI